jgi:hypothetical protein
VWLVFLCFFNFSRFLWHLLPCLMWRMRWGASHRVLCLSASQV